MRHINTKWYLLVALVAVMVISTAGSAISAFKGQFDMPGGPAVKEMFLSRVDYTIHELHLTPTQMTRYGQIRNKMAEAMDKGAEHRKAVRQSVKTALDAETPDVRALASTLKAEMRATPDMLTAQIDYLLEVYDLLDEGQRKELVNMLREEMDRHAHHHQ